MFDRPAQDGERTLLVHVSLGQQIDPAVTAEFEQLALAAGAEVITLLTAARDVPHPKTYVGSGKLDEIKDWIKTQEIDLVIFNHELSPGQERNLEKELCCRVLSRTGLILDIFAKRAQTFEGQLQVELAQLKHLSTRLVRGWTHLERQKGGIGLRGPGETQLESDRRMVRQRMHMIEKKLAKVKQQRALSRRARKRQAIPTIAFVGYTNAGKSTLFNTLTGAEVFEADQLFATLDPTHRVLQLPTIGKVILIDTVGFIRDLPHALVEAFHATLEETQLADLLCHVVDVADPEYQTHIQAVHEVLENIGAREVPHLLVYNKIDAAEIAITPHFEDGKPPKLWLSARQKEGLSLFEEALIQMLGQDRVFGRLTLRPAQSKIRAKLHDMGAILSEQMDTEGAWQLDISLLNSTWSQLCHHHPELPTQWQARQGK